VTRSKYELHETIISTKEALKHEQTLNRAHLTYEQIEVTKRTNKKIINNPRLYRSTEEDTAEVIGLSEEYPYQEIFFRNIEHENLYEKTRNKESINL
ncbi:12863_t:CDS:1, partial [Racocetra persica]